MCDIIPGILENDSLELEKKLELVKPFAKTIHVDFLDGKFSPENSLMDPTFFKKFENDFYLEAHLMVDDPTQYLRSFADSGFKRFLGHIEKMKDVDEFVAQGQILGEVGLALDIDTKVEDLKISLDNLDCILLMSVKAGKSGQVFSNSVLEKIKFLRNKTQIPIEIDGGINDQTVILAKNEGANRFVTTSFIFQTKDPKIAFSKICALV